MPAKNEFPDMSFNGHIGIYRFVILLPEKLLNYNFHYC